VCAVQLLRGLDPGPRVMLAVMLVALGGGSSALPLQQPSCTNATAVFPDSLDGMECWGLRSLKTGKLGNPITTVDGCASACCALSTCTIYNFNSTVPLTTAGCWVAHDKIGAHMCRPVKGWVGRGGRGEAPLPPPPPPCAAPAGSLALCLRPCHALGATRSTTQGPAPGRGSCAAPLAFAPDASAGVAPNGSRVGADSRSLLRSTGSGPMQRWYPVSGEVHLARLPAAEWREQLMRMKGGGLDMIAVYVFWIHHEEARGTFNFTGRRDIRRFVTTAKEVGLKVMMRIGPWDHGECRNGGHPDWVLTQCGKVRTTDPKYLSCVEGWYSALAGELKGLYHKDGGPILMAQVDNETPNWRFLLALKMLAQKHGIEPPFFTKTGWPSPSLGYPSDYPMLPFFGGYADQFWTNEMQPSVSSGSYTFGAHTSGIAGTPFLGVEIGGGMAAAYNHRVHMFSEDMPSMHTVDVANGFSTSLTSLLPAALHFSSAPTNCDSGVPLHLPQTCLGFTCIMVATTHTQRSTLATVMTQQRHCKRARFSLLAPRIRCRAKAMISLHRLANLDSHAATTTRCDACITW
jgi:hypothetical protein